MIHYIQHIKDTLGNNYLGIKIYPETVSPFLNDLKEILGEEDYELYTDAQKKRDNGSHHITVVNVMDYNNTMKSIGVDDFVKRVGLLFKYGIDDLKLMGIGSAQKNENKAYFVVCKSDKLDAVRKSFNLPEHDFHITLGFKYRDVFGVRKNQLIEKDNKFIKLLSNSFYNYGNFNFIKDIENYNFNKDLEPKMVDVTKTLAKFTLDDNNSFEVGLVDDKLRVVSSWVEKLTPLSNTIVMRKLLK